MSSAMYSNAFVKANKGKLKSAASELTKKAILPRASNVDQTMSLKVGNIPEGISGTSTPKVG